MKQHKWYEVIVAWAEGEEIECKDTNHPNSIWGPWNEDDDGVGPIDWNTEDYIFRIKRDDQKSMDALNETLDEIVLLIAKARWITK